MQAAVYRGESVVSIERVPTPAIGPGEILVRVEACGICGSDVHYYLHGAIGPYVVREPMILGHEAAGIVVELLNWRWIFFGLLHGMAVTLLLVVQR